MNSVWKRSWKEYAKSAQEGRQLDGSSSGASIMDVTEAGHPSPATSLVHDTGHKRNYTDSPDDERIHKKMKYHTHLGGTKDHDFASPSLGERVMIYSKGLNTSDTQLLRELRRYITPSHNFWPHIQASQDALIELGQCASDLVWRRLVAELTHDGYDTDCQEALRQILRDWVFVLPNLDSNSSRCNVSHKFQVLVKALQCCAPSHTPFSKGVLLVNRPYAVPLVIDLMHMLRPQLEFVMPVAIAGKNTHDEETFARSLFNLVVSSDPEIVPRIGDLSFVILFDQMEFSVLEQIRRSCQRGKLLLVHLVQEGNEKHRRALVDPCYIAKEKDYPTDHETFIEDPTTRRRIYSGDAIEVIQAVLRLKCPDREHEAFVISESKFSSEFQYTVTVNLPGMPPIIGSTFLSSYSAQVSACFKACRVLSDGGVLDYQLYPSSGPPTNLGNVMIETRHCGTKVYARKSPLFWQQPSTSSTRFYPMVLVPARTKENLSPLALLTRLPLPDIADIELYRYLAPLTMKVVRGYPLEVTEDMSHKLYRYTLRIVRSLTNKRFECPLESVKYFLAPLDPGYLTASRPPGDLPFSLPSIKAYIPWDAVTLAGDSSVRGLSALSSEEAEREIEDAVLQDRWVEFTRRYVALRVRPDLTPLSKPSENTREFGYDTYVDYCKSRIKDFQGIRDHGQPLIEVGPLHSTNNHLTPASAPPEPAGSLHTRFLIPELCTKFTIPASIMLTATFIPSITRRIDDLLVVKELNARLFDCKISEELLLQALCTSSATAGYNYERLELLGDSYLKFLTSIYCFHRNPTASEGALHSARQPLISNSSLFQQAWERKIPLYMQSTPFTSKNWHPPNFQWIDGAKMDKGRQGILEEVEVPPELPEEHATEGKEPAGSHQPGAAPKLSKSQRRRKARTKSGKSHELGDKALADVVEAIIGAAYLTGGDEIALQAAKALGVALEGVDHWSDFASQTLDLQHELKMHPPSGALLAIEETIAHKIDHGLLSKALTPRSIAHERLEFLGDAIIDFSVIRYLYGREPNMTPGGLTLLKGGMVSNAALAAACVWSGLHKYLIHDPQISKTVIHRYIATLEASKLREYEAAAAEGREPGQFWLGLDYPKVLSDTLEATVGAIFISDRCSLAGVECLFEKILKPFFEKHIALKSLTHHPTKNLFELLQAKGCQRFKMQKERTHGVTVCALLVHDITFAKGEDRVAAVAARRASLAALAALEKDDAFLHCDCRSKVAPTKKEQNETRQILSLEQADRTTKGKALTGPVDEDGIVESDLEEGMIIE